MDIFGNILFSSEMLEYNVKRVYFNKQFDLINVIWTMDWKVISKDYFKFKSFLRKHLNDLKNGIGNLNSYYFIGLEEIDQRNNIKFKSKRLFDLFDRSMNSLQIYSKRSAKNEFNGEIFLICSLVDSIDEEFLKYNSEMFEEESFEEAYVRFGIYQSIKHQLKTFSFYQINKDPSAMGTIDSDGENFFNGDTIKVFVIPTPENINSFEKLIQFIIEFTSCYCY